MKSFILNSFESVGAIKFGEARAFVRETLGEFSEYKKNKFSKNTLDDFKFCQVFYSSENTVVAVELYRNAELIYNGVNLFSLNVDEIMSLFDDPIVKRDSYGIEFPSFGVSISIEENLPASILVYQKGYM